MFKVGRRSFVGIPMMSSHNPKGPRTQIIGSLERGYGGRNIWGLYKGPRIQIIRFSRSNTINIAVLGP